MSYDLSSLRVCLAPNTKTSPRRETLAPHNPGKCVGRLGEGGAGPAHQSGPGTPEVSPTCSVLRRKPRTLLPGPQASSFLCRAGDSFEVRRKSWSGQPTLWRVGCVSDISPLAMETGGGGERGPGRTVARKLGLSSLHKPTPDRPRGVEGWACHSRLRKAGGRSPFQTLPHRGTGRKCQCLHSALGSGDKAVRGQRPGVAHCPGLVPVTLGLRQQYSLTASTHSRHSDWEALGEEVGGNGLLLLTNPPKWPLAS